MSAMEVVTFLDTLIVQWLVRPQTWAVLATSLLCLLLSLGKTKVVGPLLIYLLGFAAFGIAAIDHPWIAHFKDVILWLFAILIILTLVEQVMAIHMGLWREEKTEHIGFGVSK